MTVQHFAELKYRLQTASSHAGVMRYFFKYFGDRPELIQKSEPHHDELLEKVLMITLQFTLNQPNPTLREPRFMRVPSEKMVHGGFQLPDGSVGSFFYFEDIDLGLVGVSGGALGPQLVTARFKVKMVSR